MCEQKKKQTDRRVNEPNNCPWTTFCKKKISDKIIAYLEEGEMVRPLP